MNLFEFLKVNDFNVSIPLCLISIGFRPQLDPPLCYLAVVRAQVPKNVPNYPL